MLTVVLKEVVLRDGFKSNSNISASSDYRGSSTLGIKRVKKRHYILFSKHVTPKSSIKKNLANPGDLP